jgi:hypothetical protein
MDTIKRAWRTYIPPGSPSFHLAGATSDRVYYVNLSTGDMCYRLATWGDHGTGMHGFRDSGPGVGIDCDMRPNGKTYDASEFWTP